MQVWAERFSWSSVDVHRATPEHPVSDVVLGFSVRRLVVIWVSAYHVTAMAIPLTVMQIQECAEIVETTLVAPIVNSVFQDST